MNATPSTTEERLELGELLTFAECPFTLPAADDRTFLQRMRLHRAKEIAYDPERQRTVGVAHRVVHHQPDGLIEHPGFLAQQGGPVGL